ncbi:Kinesin-like protein KIF21A [Durusdinium trenchii]|uniref:Kinesin-like protein KIF21A n=1 Tax=Durusdinium trenchii TaxID=1381693 RepID=A0ABP0HM22_9DINO
MGLGALPSVEHLEEDHQFSTREEFEAGVMKLKGFARAFDLNKLQRQVRKMNAKMDLLIHNSGLSHFRNDKPKGRAMSSPGCSETTPPFWAKNRGLSRDTF